MKVFWNADYTSLEHDFDTSRKSNNVIRLLAQGATQADVEIVDPDGTTDMQVTDSLIEKWLEPKYLDALKTGNDRHLAESQEFPWSNKTFNFARSHTHGLISAIDVVASTGGRSGSLSSGLHHATQSTGAGYCTINGIALAAIHTGNIGLRPVVLDFDAHCGGGTMSFLRQRENVVHIDVSTDQFDSYMPSDERERNWSHLHITQRGEIYLDNIKRALEIAASHGSQNTVYIYNAGIDSFGSFDIDDSVIAERELLVSDFIGDARAVFALAGGYSGAGISRDDVARTHLINIIEWASRKGSTSAS